MKHREIELSVTHGDTDLAQRHNSFPYHQVLLNLNAHHFSVFSMGPLLTGTNSTGLVFQQYIHMYSLKRLILSFSLSDSLLVFVCGVYIYTHIYTYIHTKHLAVLKIFHTQSPSYHFKTLTKYLVEIKVIISICKLEKYSVAIGLRIT